ncbi:hypothetical protein [Pedobacter sp. MC2016-24]|uniref:hypothetical protein n=1 Tax=Pedobacter sp. MC2016-24 TaxID=2780090 RepID=UPI00187DF1BA|nr:hypothetical protein [Pedobacter sp. MC2016-24]MBE9603227.1 hypothetical protein [Pedobacter sp. MC2016-24]
MRKHLKYIDGNSDKFWQYYPDADQIFDFSRKIEFMNQELAEINIDPALAGGTIRTDLLAKVFL